MRARRAKLGGDNRSGGMVRGGSLKKYEIKGVKSGIETRETE